MSPGSAPNVLKISPNYTDPAPLTLGEAAAHLWRNRFFHPIVLAVAACIVALYRLAFLLPFAIGAAVAFLGLAFTYTLAYVAFVSHNRRCGTLCPACTSRMWQFCCARCREPVPPLAFLSFRLLLARCPHCGYSFSGDGRLLAWCSTCSYAVSKPGRFYAKPTLVVVAAVSDVAAAGAIGAPWQPVPIVWPGRLIFYRPSDHHSSSLMVVLDHTHDKLPGDPLLSERTCLVLMPEKAPGAAVNRVAASFPGRPLERSSALS